MIKNLTVPLNVRNPCRGQCVKESRCVSINIGPQINDKIICEQNDSDHSLHPKDFQPRSGFTYTGTEVRQQTNHNSSTGNTVYKQLPPKAQEKEIISEINTPTADTGRKHLSENELHFSPEYKLTHRFSCLRSRSNLFFWYSLSL